jgi:hypothetical protein
MEDVMEIGKGLIVEIGTRFATGMPVIGTNNLVEIVLQQTSTVVQIGTHKTALAETGVIMIGTSVLVEVGIDTETVGQDVSIEASGIGLLLMTDPPEEEEEEDGLLLLMIDIERFVN